LKEAPKNSASNNHQHKPFFNQSGPDHFFGGRNEHSEMIFLQKPEYSQNLKLEKKMMYLKSTLTKLLIK